MSWRINTSNGTQQRNAGRRPDDVTSEGIKADSGQLQQGLPDLICEVRHNAL
jgi:hypothetical protein